MANFKTVKGTSDLEVKNSIEIFEVVFVDHVDKSAKNMILQIAPNGNWFDNPAQKLSWERNYSILDGTKKEKIQVPFTSEILVETPIGIVKLSRNAVLDVK